MSGFSDSKRSLLKTGSVAIAAAFGGPIAAMASRAADDACMPATASILGGWQYRNRAVCRWLSRRWVWLVLQHHPGAAVKSVR